MPKYQIDVHMVIQELWKATLDVEAANAQSAGETARARVQAGEDCWESAEIINREFSFHSPIEEEKDD